MTLYLVLLVTVVLSTPSWARILAQIDLYKNQSCQGNPSVADAQLYEQGCTTELSGSTYVTCSIIRKFYSSDCSGTPYARGKCYDFLQNPEIWSRQVECIDADWYKLIDNGGSTCPENGTLVGDASTTTFFKGPNDCRVLASGGSGFIANVTDNDVVFGINLVSSNCEKDVFFGYMNATIGKCFINPFTSTTSIFLTASSSQLFLSSLILMLLGGGNLRFD